MSTEPLVSVIIPSYKNKEYIFDAVSSVLRQETDFEYEVIVVDSSGDDTASLLRDRFPQIRVIELQQRAFPGTARNYGIREAKGQFFSFTDADCIVHRHWLKYLVESHRRGYAVVGGRVKNGTPWSLWGTIDYLLECSDLLKPFETTRNSHFGTGNLSLKREIVQKYGMFIDQIKGSDSIYCRMLKKNGETLFHQPKAIIWHRNRTRPSKIFKNQFELGYGAAFNRKKYQLKGKVFIDYPFLIVLLPFARMAAIGFRLLRYSPFDFVKFLLMSPLTFPILCYYAYGFVRGRADVLKQDL